jgi:hypothetical protein
MGGLFEKLSNSEEDMTRKPKGEQAIVTLKERL